MSELTLEMLRSLAPQDLATHLPAPVYTGERAGVVLRLVDTDLIEFYFAGRITTYSTQVLQIRPITDPAVREATLREAIEALAICRKVAIEKHAEQHRSHELVMDAIRQYAVDRHEEGDICREGLDDFLANFGLASYVTRVRVEYTITGSYEVDPSSEAAAEEDALKCLQPDLSGLDDVDGDTSTYEVSEIQVSEV
ncbi:hypothetical protein [Streptomyces canus]|uniref:hypothetical protein n=1 Tax=Streptomyces canus TaxID=58343 RepID=UPI00224FB1C1|nr:hypothetical protein [Streptomyces canus]MCX4856633.1 hypothetical protein [Streptomyces canus]